MLSLLTKSCYMFPQYSRRISNELGARRPNDAYLAVFDTLFMGLTCGVLEFSLMMSIRKCT
jgi:hypothetical protein